MFTGLVQDIGRVEAVKMGASGARLRIATRLAPELASGDSIAVDGACLTAASAAETAFEADVMNQTLSVTALAELAAGDPVNLELAMKATDRFGGHIVQGHVDGVGEVLAIEEDGFARRLRLGLSPALLRYVIEKGSIALDGVSLTVADVGDSWLEVSLIPETIERTKLDEASPGAKLNVECDLVAKYVERLAAPIAGKEGA
jgi:riboflavin synthase